MALVPLEDLREVDPDARLARQLAALDETERLARLKPLPDGFDAIAMIREMRADRTAQVMRAVADGMARRA